MSRCPPAAGCRSIDPARLQNPMQGAAQTKVNFLKSKVNRTHSRAALTHSAVAHVAVAHGTVSQTAVCHINISHIVVSHTTQYATKNKRRVTRRFASSCRAAQQPRQLPASIKHPAPTASSSPRTRSTSCAFIAISACSPLTAASSSGLDARGVRGGFPESRPNDGHHAGADRCPARRCPACRCPGPIATCPETSKFSEPAEPTVSAAAAAAATATGIAPRDGSHSM